MPRTIASTACRVRTWSPRPHRGCATALAAGLVALLAQPQTAAATPIPVTSLSFEMQGLACGGGICGSPIDAKYAFQTNDGPTSDPLEVALGGAAVGTVSGMSDFGHAALTATADAQSTDTGQNAEMLSVAQAQWTDYFTVGNAHVAPGSIVHVRAVVAMDGVTDVSGGTLRPNGNTNEAGIDSQWSFFASMQNAADPSNYISICADSLFDGCLLGPNTPFASEQAFVFNLSVDDVTPITGILLIAASAGSFSGADGAFATSSVSSLANHSGHFYLQPIEDFTLIAASGHDYSLPTATPPESDPTVPEPASLLLVGAGLSAMIVRRRNRARG